MAETSIASPMHEDGTREARIGARLRDARREQGWSLRRLAEHVGISSSALSQIETEKSSPSVRTVYAIASKLGLSLDELFKSPDESKASGNLTRIVQPRESRVVLHLDSGVTWERLTPLPDGDVDFVEATYAVGGASGIDGQRIRHMGREYGIVLSGELELTVGSETFLLGPGDSCSFSSDDPHRLANPGQEPTRVIWLVVGRRGLDPRRFNLQGELDR